MAVVLVRHAVAAARSDWDGDDALRPLTGRGREQADGLVPILTALRPARLLTSPSTRCVDTLAPTSEAIGVPLELTDDLFEGNGARALDLVGSLHHDARTSVLCTHGDVLPDVLDGLSVRGMAGWHPNGRCEKGGCWVVAADGDGRLHARYVPPPA